MAGRSDSASFWLEKLEAARQHRSKFVERLLNDLEFVASERFVRVRFGREQADRVSELPKVEQASPDVGLNDS